MCPAAVLSVYMYVGSKYFLYMCTWSVSMSVVGGELLYLKPIVM